MSQFFTEAMSASETLPPDHAPPASRKQARIPAGLQTPRQPAAPARPTAAQQTIAELARQALRTVSDKSRTLRNGSSDRLAEDGVVPTQAPARFAAGKECDEDSDVVVDDDFIRELVGGPRQDAQNLLRTLRARNLTDEELVEDVIPGTARLLGERWMESRLSFTEVSIGTSLLQAVLRLVASRDDGGCARGQVPGPELLIVVPTNEQHTLGAQVAAEQLRGRGLEVDVSLHEDVGEIVARLKRGHYAMVVYSIAQREVLATVRRDIEILRGGHGFNIPIVIGGWIALSTSEAEVDRKSVV